MRSSSVGGPAADRQAMVRLCVPRFFRLLLSLLAILPAFLLTPERVLAQPVVRFGGSTAVGASAKTQAVIVTMRRAGTLDSVHVRSGGNDGFDFSLAQGGSCIAGSGYAAGQQCSAMVAFSPVAPGQRTGAVLLLDRNGAVLGSTLLTANSTGGLHVFVPGTIQTIAGEAVWLYSGDGSPATNEAIFLPFGVAVDASGAIFIADSSNNRVRRVDPVTNLMTTVAGNGMIGFSGDSGQATRASLTSPTSVAVDPAGNLLITDSGNNVIRRVDAFDGTISTFAGLAGQHGYAGDGGAASGASLNVPNGLAFDGAGNLYIADTGNDVVRRVDAVTGVIVTIAGTGTPGYTGDGGLATAASLNGPWGMAVSPAGAVYVADQNNQVVRMIDTAGVIHTLAGNGSAGFSGDGSAATSAMLNAPAGVAVDPAGNIYIADSGNNRVRKINASTGVITTIAGNKSQAFSGDGGPADAAGLYGPYTLAINSLGDLLIADVFHNRIRKIAATSATLMYSPMRVGRTSSPQQQLMENDGNATMTVASVDPTSNSAVDPTATTCTNTLVLAPLDQCTLSVSFAPTTTGSLVTGTATVRSDAGNAPGILTLQGQVLDIDPATITLTSATNPSQTGNPVVFTVGVTSDGNAPTGTVSLLDGNTVVASTTLDKYSNGNFTVSGLKSGQHVMTAYYAGDASNTSATSPAVVQVVKDAIADTSTILSASANPITAGANLRLTAQVQTQVAGAGNGSISGTMTFKDGSVVLGTATVSAGTATLQTTLATGQHSLTANYAGSSSYGPSASPALTEMGTIATSTTSLTSSLNPSPAGAALTLSTTVKSNGGTPGGSVTFADGPAMLGSAVLNASGMATLVVPGAAWTVGTHPLTASYAGDVNDQPSGSASVSEVVTLAQTNLLLGSSANPVGLGGAVTFTATVSGSGGTPSGMVQFLDGGISLGTATLNQSGAGTLTTSALTQGDHAITAIYGGDTYDGPSNSSPLKEQVQAASAAIVLTTATNPSLGGAPLTLSGTVSGTGSQPTGTVNFLDGGVVIGSAVLDQYGYASISTSTLSLGAHTLTAVYAGDRNHGPVVSAALTERIQQATTTGFTASTLRSIAGSALQWTVTVIGRSGQPVTGSVSIMNNGSLLATVQLDSAGTGVYTTTALTPGQHVLLATYPGDANDTASTSASLVNVVELATTTIGLTSNANPANSGATLVLTATVAGNGGTPTGKVTFLDGSTVLGTGILPANGVAIFQISTLTPGIHALTAGYSGDTNDGPATSPVLNQQIAQRTSVGLSSSANPSLLTDAITLTAKVSNGTAGVPSGAVTLTEGGTPVGTANLDAAGNAGFAIVSPSLSKHSYTVNYAGDAKNLPASSSTLIQEVDLRPTGTTLSISSSSLSAGQTTVFVAVVQGQGSRAPGGTVTFASGSTVLGSGILTATGVVTVTLTPPEGTFNVVATYSGDTLFAASLSSPAAVIVGPTIEFTLATTPGAMTLKSGAHGTMQLALASAPTFTDTLALGCAGLPAMATCTFSDNQIKVAGGIAKSLTVTLDTGAPLGSGASASTRGAGSGAWLCGLPAGALLLLLAGGRRWRRPVGLLCALLMLGGLLATTGCGNSFVEQATPAGSYSFQIVASGNTSGATQTTTVKLTVTP